MTLWDSTRIVGYELSDNMHAFTTRRALKKALSQRKGIKPLIHHSDRGLQYSSSEYTSLLKANGIAISMRQDADPYENAIAERVNGILKDDFGLNLTLQSKTILKQHVVQSIALYNQLRPHMSIEMLTPNQAHKQDRMPLKTWKTEHPSKHALKGVDIKLKLEILSVNLFWD
jgi:transposase InsO family protein